MSQSDAQLTNRQTKRLSDQTHPASMLSYAKHVLDPPPLDWTHRETDAVPLGLYISLIVNNMSVHQWFLTSCLGLSAPIGSS